MKEDVYLCQTCDNCARNQRPVRTPKAPFGNMIDGVPKDRLATYFLGPLPLTPRGNIYIF